MPPKTYFCREIQYKNARHNGRLAGNLSFAGRFNPHLSSAPGIHIFLAIVIARCQSARSSIGRTSPIWLLLCRRDLAALECSALSSPDERGSSHISLECGAVQVLPQLSKGQG